MQIQESQQKKQRLVPNYLTEILRDILLKIGEPLDITKLLNKAVTMGKGDTIEFLEKKLYVVAKGEESYFTIDEYPSFKLRRVSTVPDLSDISRGMKYLTAASKILYSSKDYVDVRDIVRGIKDKGLYKFSTSEPEYWMCVWLKEYKEIFSQKGALKIGLTEWRTEKSPSQSKKRRLSGGYPSSDKIEGNVTPNIHEANLESIIVEHLERIEKGLKLIARQYICPGVGRIDVLCEDKQGDLVVIELKKFGGKQGSIVDQVARYMGYIKTHVARRHQNVRGILIVAKADERLRYAIAAFPSIEIKTFNLTIE